MITAFELYWILKLDAISHVATFAAAIAGVVSGVMFVIYLFASFAEDDNSAFVLKKVCVYAFRVFVVSLIASILIPTTKQMAAIMVIPRISTIENVEALTSEAKSLYELTKEYFRESVDKEVK